MTSYLPCFLFLINGLTVMSQFFLIFSKKDLYNAERTMIILYIVDNASIKLINLEFGMHVNVLTNLIFH